MKHNILLKILRTLIFLKRLFWWCGAKISFILAQIFLFGWRPFGYINYRVSYFFKKIGIGKTNGWFLKRNYLQIFIFLVLFFVAVPQTKIYSKIYTQNDSYLPGQKTIAYRLSGADEEYNLEMVTADNKPSIVSEVSSWRQGSVVNEQNTGAEINLKEQEFFSVVAGGLAISKPVIISGSVVVGRRDKVESYIVQSGDSLSSIAYQYGISIATVLWENKLSLRSIIRPGDKLSIPPTTGVMHTVKKGETIKKIASTYSAKAEEIIVFNKLKEDGSDLKIGERLMVPNGIKPEERAVATISRSAALRQATPPGSRQSPGASGFIWPSAVKYISQYYGWTHHALDIAGPRNSANYAAKSGVVEMSQCGWNSGYGCYIVINHGGGVKTLYGHNSKLLVSKGDEVRAGQTIALMGNTGKVRGRTGIHLHFEIQINGVRVNPLGYVR